MNNIKKYSIIYSDPPWSYNDKALAGDRGACCKYKTMAQSGLISLPIKDMADEDCVLFMWVTMPKLNECFDLIKAWGFEYKTVAFTWVKTNKVSGTWFMGMGRWTRANAELCLLATKGKPKRVSAAVSQIIDSPIDEHSKKPDIVRNRIVELMGDIPRIELFARGDKSKDLLGDNRFDGWDTWGNEVECDIELQFNKEEPCT